MALKVNDIPYPQAIKTAQAICTAAKAGDANVTDAVMLYEAGDGGALITKITANPRATVTATRLAVYRVKPAAPAVAQLIRARTMAAANLSATAHIIETDLGWSDSVPLKCQAGDQIWVAIGVALAAGIVFDAEIEEFQVEAA